MVLVVCFVDHWFSDIAASVLLMSAALGNGNSASLFTNSSAYLAKQQNISLNSSCLYAFAICIVITYNAYASYCYIP